LVFCQAHNLKAAGSNPAPAIFFQVMGLNFYQVYVLQNLQGRFYIGISDDVSRRLQDHNTGISQWTKAKGPWTLKWTSEAMSHTEARKLENRLKRMKGGEGFYRFTGLQRKGS
jgi:predicted GIY-YIG superfamily endonuclease